MAAAATAFMAPMLLSGTLPPGDDLPFALQLVRNVSDGLAAGTPWPRWVDAMNASLGGPALAFYAPLGPWLGGWVTWATGSVVVAIQLVSWGAALAAGLALAWAVQPRCRPRAAALAGSLYVLLPYHFVDQYPRFAFAETLAFVFAPLVFGFADRILCAEVPAPGARLRCLAHRFAPAGVGLAVSLAALLCTHTLSAGLVGVGLAFYVAFRIALPSSLLHQTVPVVVQSAAQTSTGEASRGSTGRTVLTRSTVFFVAAVLAVALAAFQVGPMLAEQSNLQVEAWTGAHGALARNFLFRDETAMGFSRARIKPLVEASMIPTAALALLAAAAIWRRSRHAPPAAIGPLARESACMGGMAACVALLQLPISAPLWHMLPFASRVQFPWRFGVVLAMAAAWLFASLLECWACMDAGEEPVATDAPARADAPARWREPGQMIERGLALVLVVWAVGVGFQAAVARPEPPGTHWFDAPALRERIVPEYLPPGVDVVDVRRFARTRPPAAWASGRAEIEVQSWTPGHRSFAVQAEDSVDFVVATFAHPRWQARVNGAPAEVTAQAPLYLLGVTLPPGRNEVRFDFGRGPFDLAGASTSAVGGLVVVALLVFARRGERRS